MLLTDIGPRGFDQDVGVATLSFVPQTDRAAKVTRVNVTNTSAADVWVFTTGGQEVGRFQAGLDVAQDLLGDSGGSNIYQRDVFSWYEQVYNDSLIYPVPNGETFSVASVGGATADIAIEYMEVSNGDISPTLVNHPKGKKFCVAYYAGLTSTATDIAETPFNFEIHPSGFPNLFSGSSGQTGYDAMVKALWASSLIVSGASLEYIFALLGGQRLFTRAALGGIPIIPQSSGSVPWNTPFPPFQLGLDAMKAVVNPGISIPAGVISTWGYGVASPGGSDDFSAAQMVALVDITVKGA